MNIPEVIYSVADQSGITRLVSFFLGNIMTKQRHNQKGFTLAEALMAMVVLSIATAGLILPFSSAAAVQSEGTTRTLAAKLAGDLIERIISADFDQIVAAYDGYSESAGQVKDFGGSIISDSTYTKFSRTAACEYVYLSGQAAIVSPNFIKVTVLVYYDGREVAELVRLKSK